MTQKAADLHIVRFSPDQPIFFAVTTDRVRFEVAVRNATTAGIYLNARPVS